MRHRFVAAAVASSALALILTIGPPASGAAARHVSHPPANYLAVGDSVTYGFGVPADQSYPRLLDASSRHVKLADNLAMNGASVADVATQLSTFAGDKSKITKISLTVGANDIGWQQALFACLNVPAPIRCADLPVAPGVTLQQLVDAGVAGLSVSLPALLDLAGTMYPSASIHVGSYYELFGSKKEDCVIAPPSTGFPGLSVSLVNKRWYNALARRANATIKAAVKAANLSPAGNDIRVRFVNVAPRFNGHAFCDFAQRWVIAPQDVPPGGDLGSVAHPNINGQRTYAQMFAAKGIR